MVAQSLKMRGQDSWVVVRAVAYSGLPNWQELLRHFAGRMPDCQPLIERYLAGKLPRLDQLTITPSPSGWQRFVAHFRIGKAKHKVALEPSPEVLDVLWGYYFATGGYGPIVQMAALLPWSDDRDDAARLTVGSMAKFTLARNASHDAALLGMLKSTRWRAINRKKRSRHSTRSSRRRRTSTRAPSASRRSPPSTTSSARARPINAMPLGGAMSGRARSRPVASPPLSRAKRHSACPA